MSTALEAETIEHLDFEEHRACEHSAHGEGDHHADGGEQFVRLVYPCCSAEGRVIVLCNRILTTARFIECAKCGACRHKRDFWTPLGPANH